MKIHDVLAMDEEEEIRTLNIPSATIVWSGPYTVGAVARKSGSGLYVVVKGQKPIYVGQTVSFKSRFSGRLRVLRQVACDFSRHKVYLGLIQLPKGGGKSTKLRLDLESVLIRSYRKRGKKLTNRSSIRQFRMGPKDALILNKGMLPPKMKKRITIKRNELFELDFVDETQESYEDAFDESAEFELEMLEFEEEELRRKRRRPVGRRPKSIAGRTHPSRPRLRAGKPKPRRRIRRPRRRPLIIRRPRTVIRQNEPCICPPGRTEFVRWVQSSLNQIFGLGLRINGVMNRATRDALRDFQKREGLPVDGIAGPETKQALIAARVGQSSMANSESSTEPEHFLGSLWN